MPQQQPGAAAYADPVLRGTSPSSSISTLQGNDQTAFGDDVSADDFHVQMEQIIGLRKISEQEKAANESPFIKVPPHYYDPRCSDTGEAERDAITRDMERNVMINLRQLVAKVEEEQRFEEVMKKSLLRHTEQVPDSTGTDLSALLESMMGPKKQVEAHPHVNGKTKT